MKRALAATLILFFGGTACSIFRSKAHSYPSGIIFPLAESESLPVEGKVVRSLVRQGGRLYFSTDKGFVYGLDEPSRKIVWTYKTDAAFGCPPAVAGRVAAVWDLDNVVHAMDLDGHPLWKTPLNEPIASDISASRDRFYVGTKSGRLFALDAATGTAAWSFETAGAIEAACVTWLDRIIVGSMDGRLYFLSSQGKLLKELEAGAPIRVTPLVDGARLYYGTEDGHYSCLDIPGYSRRWRRPTNGRLTSPAVADPKRVYFGASNTVLYAVDKSNGDIIWWSILPSRSEFRPELAGARLLATCSSPVVLGLDRKHGEEVGRFDIGRDVRSNPIWSTPDIFVAEYDSAETKGTLAVLRKSVKVDLAAAPAQPGAVGTEVALTASAVGFFEPKYEFYIRSDGRTTVLQKASPKTTCTWFPDKIAEFTLGVRARDAKETKEAEITYKVVK